MKRLFQWLRLLWMRPIYINIMPDGSEYVTNYPMTFIPYRPTRTELLHNSRMGMTAGIKEKR